MSNTKQIRDDTIVANIEILFDYSNQDFHTTRSKWLKNYDATIIKYKHGTNKSALSAMPKILLS